MTNTVLLNELQKIKNNKKTLETLIKEVELEVLKSDFKEVTSAKRLNHCMNYHKKMLKNARPIFAYACNDQLKDTQIITNSYFLVALKEDDILPIPDYTSFDDGKRPYPNTTHLIEFAFNRKNKNTINLNTSELLKACSLKKPIAFYKNTELVVAFAYDVLKDLIIFMNFKNDDTISLTYDVTNPLVVNTVTKNNGSTGCICPVKINKDTFNEDDYTLITIN